VINDDASPPNPRPLLVLSVTYCFSPHPLCPATVLPSLLLFLLLPQPATPTYPPPPLDFPWHVLIFLIARPDLAPFLPASIWLNKILTLILISFLRFDSLPSARTVYHILLQSNKGFSRTICQGPWNSSSSKIFLISQIYQFRPFVGVQNATLYHFKLGKPG